MIDLKQLIKYHPKLLTTWNFKKPVIASEITNHPKNTKKRELYIKTLGAQQINIERKIQSNGIVL